MAMRPPHRDEPPGPLVQRVGEDGVVYVDRSTKGSWEDKQRSRSCPGSGGLFFGALSVVILWLSMAGLILSLVMKTLGHHQPWTVLCIVFGGVSMAALAASLGFSLNVKCPLCHGTPLHSRHGCRKHRLSERWPLLTRRATVVLRILTTLSFRCMYCGTPFRLFKKSSRLRE